MKFKVRSEAKELSEKGLRKKFRTKGEFQNAVGLSHPTVRPLFKGSGEVSINTVSKFAETLDLEISDLVYLPVGLLDRSDDVDDKGLQSGKDWDILIQAGVAILKRMEEKKSNFRIETITIQELSFETKKLISPAEIRYILGFADTNREESMNRFFWKIVEEALLRVNKALQLNEFGKSFEDCNDEELWAQELKDFLCERLSDYERVFEEYSFLFNLIYYLIEKEPLVYRPKVEDNQDPLLKKLKRFYSNQFPYLFSEIEAEKWSGLRKEALMSALLLGPIVSTRLYQDVDITAKIHDLRVLLTLLFEGIAPVTKERIKRLCRRRIDRLRNVKVENKTKQELEEERVSIDEKIDDELCDIILYLGSEIKSSEKKQRLIESFKSSS